MDGGGKPRNRPTEKSNIGRPTPRIPNERRLFPKLDAIKYYSSKVKERKEKRGTISKEWRKRSCYSCVPRKCWDRLLFLFPLNRAIKSTRPPINDATFVSLLARHQMCFDSSAARGSNDSQNLQLVPELAEKYYCDSCHCYKNAWRSRNTHTNTALKSFDLIS